MGRICVAWPDSTPVAVDDIDETLERLRTPGARSSWARSSGTKRCIGSATSAGLKGWSSDLPRNSAERRRVFEVFTVVKSAAYAVCVVALALVALSGPWIRSNIREAHLKRRMAAFGQRLATLQKERAYLQARSNPLEAGERRNKQLRTMAPANVRLPDESGGVDAIARTLMSVFNQTDILALGESHEQQSESDLRIALVRHPGFAKTVRAIVVEFGSASRQATLDRYIRGEDVPRGQLQQVSQTTQVGGGGSPIYPAFFAAVRDVNSRLPAGAQVRVFGAAGAPGSSGETAAVALLKREALQKQGKALVIFGHAHFWRTGGIVKMLETDYPGRTFAVIPVGGPAHPLPRGAKGIVPDFQKFDRALKTPVRPVLVSLRRPPFRDFLAEEFLGRSVIQCTPAAAAVQPKGPKPSGVRVVDATDSCRSFFQGSTLTLGQLADAMVYVGPETVIAPKARPGR